MKGNSESVLHLSSNTSIDGVARLLTALRLMPSTVSCREEPIKTHLLAAGPAPPHYRP